MIAGLGQVKTLGVLYGQGHFGVGRAVVFQHGDVILFHRCGSGESVVGQCPLGDICLLYTSQGFSAAFASAAPSFHPIDLLIGLAAAVIIRLVVYYKQKNAKKYRKGME